MSTDDTDRFGVYYCHDCQWCDAHDDGEVEWNGLDPNCPNCGGYAFAY
jgi:Zn finger protein HypA/HybF involved in hydrogenase expression